MSRHSARGCARGSRPKSALATDGALPLNTARIALLVATLTVAALFSSCGDGGSDGAPTATPQPTIAPTPTEVDLGPGEPGADRVVEHIRVLSDEVGRRPSGSGAEVEAVEYASAVFESYGYDVEVQEFTAAAGEDVFLQTTVDVTSPEEREVPALLFDGGGAGDIAAPLIDAGSGLSEDFPTDAAGAVVLIQRQDVPFADMAQRALDVGASAMVVANREGGLFRGVLDPPVTLPAVAIPEEDGAALRELLAAGAVEVRINVPAEVQLRNVIARPPSGVCATVSGGHLDSVPWSPGATDNASGSAAVLDLARAAASAGLTGHCFALFGGEEIGLVGSSRFAAGLGDAERDRLQAYFNYDVVTSQGIPLYLGTTALSDEVEALAAQLGIDAQRGQLPEDVGSDHISFLDLALPALMLTTPDFALIHTPEDTLANIDTGSLQDILDLGFALLQAHGPEPAATPQASRTEAFLPGQRP